MAGPAEWIAEFRILHERARKDELTGADLKLYLGAREQLARALCAAQGLTQAEGQTARQTFRVAQAFQLEVKLPLSDCRALTLDLSLGGFSTVIAQAPEGHEPISFSLKLPGGDPLTGKAKAISVKRQPGNYRVSFAFVGLSEEELGRVERVLFDYALARMPT